jgi:hypothetical protein
MLTTGLAVCPSHAAQTVYRCGSSYSQTPCQGAVAIDADDSRSAAQKASADATIRRDGQIANSMEKARLKDEKGAAAREATARKAQAKNEKQLETKVKADQKSKSNGTGDDTAENSTGTKSSAKKKTKKEVAYFEAKSADSKSK